MRARVRCYAVALALVVMLPDAAAAQSRPPAPSQVMPGRERQQLLDQPFAPTPRIQLQDGRPAPVITQQRSGKPPKRKKRRR